MKKLKDQELKFEPLKGKELKNEQLNSGAAWFGAGVVVGAGIILFT